MDQKQPMDVASEPVDLNEDDAYMDTGVLHEARMCAKCGKKTVKKGYNSCPECLEKE